MPPEGQQDQTYRIVLRGQLQPGWESWLKSAGLTLEHQASRTVLYASVPDQAALRGLLNQLWDLNLTLIAVSCEEDCHV